MGGVTEAKAIGETLELPLLPYPLKKKSNLVHDPYSGTAVLSMDPVRKETFTCRVAKENMVVPFGIPVARYTVQCIDYGTVRAKGLGTKSPNNGRTTIVVRYYLLTVNICI